MKYGNGIVKKYSRKYNRTLKNGERKKYTTEQIQITVPKNEDIDENKEEVLIIPNSEIEEISGKVNDVVNGIVSVHDNFNTSRERISEEITTGP